MSDHPGFVADHIVQPALRRAVATAPRADIERDQWATCDSIALVILSSAVLWSIIFGTVVRLIG